MAKKCRRLHHYHPTAVAAVAAAASFSQSGMRWCAAVRRVWFFLFFPQWVFCSLGQWEIPMLMRKRKGVTTTSWTVIKSIHNVVGFFPNRWQHQRNEKYEWKLVYIYTTLRSTCQEFFYVFRCHSVNKLCPSQRTTYGNVRLFVPSILCWFSGPTW